MSAITNPEEWPKAHEVLFVVLVVGMLGAGMFILGLRARVVELEAAYTTSDRQFHEEMDKSFWAEGQLGCIRRGFTLARIYTKVAIPEQPGIARGAYLREIQCGKTADGEFIALADIERSRSKQ